MDRVNRMPVLPIALAAEPLAARKAAGWFGLPLCAGDRRRTV